jgi:hypothetical protein
MEWATQTLETRLLPPMSVEVFTVATAAALILQKY